MKIKPIKSEWIIFKLYFLLIGFLLILIGITQFFSCLPLLIFKIYSVLMFVLGVLFIYLGIK